MRRLIAALAIALAWVVPASAQAVCSNYDAAVKGLTEKHHEALIAKGQVSNGGESQQKAFIEIWASENRTWTILFRQEGSPIACWVATGDGITFAKPAPRGQDL